MEIITSRNNRKMVELAKLKSKKCRDESGLFFFEGIKLFREAITFGVPLAEVIFSESCADLANELPKGVDYAIVSSSVYEKLTDENSPQGVFCVAKHLDNLHKSATIYEGSDHTPSLLLEGIRDPGNLGTILRTAYAFGIDRLILSQDCADLYNAKTIRAAMGAVFRQKTVRVSDCIQTVRTMQDNGIPVYAAVLKENSKDVRQITYDSPVCFAVGNEGHGLSDDLIGACQGSVMIPMMPGCESLNAAVASTVLMWEMVRNGGDRFGQRQCKR
ncbi:MAG: TrmH family RNA methyltransferase [Eubacteriales bacterium]